MKRPDENTLDKYLDGLLSPKEANQVEMYLEMDNSMLEDADPSNRVGNLLRELDPSSGLFDDVDLTCSINSKLLPTEKRTRGLFKKLVFASVAAALLIAFLAAFFAPTFDAPGFTYSTPEVALADGFEFSCPGASEWEPLTTSTLLTPGCLVRPISCGSLLAFADGSTITLRDGTEIIIGGSEEFNFSFYLIKGELRADLRGSLYAIATNPTNIQCREGQFVLYADDPLVRPPVFTDACSTFSRVDKKMTILTVSLGLVETDNEKFEEGSRRDWPYLEESQIDMASLGSSDK